MPTISQTLWALGETVDFERKYKLKQGKTWVWADPMLPTAGPETFIEILEDFMSRKID